MKTIIVYSTKYGSVEKVALKIQEQLEGEVSLAKAKDNPDIKEYDSVVLGGSIYAGSIQKEMKVFIKSNQNELLKKTKEWASESLHSSQAGAKAKNRDVDYIG